VRYVAILVLACATSVQAQVIELSGGSSSVSQTSGGGVTVYTDKVQYYGGLGYSYGHLVGGASATFKAPELSDTMMTLGDKPVGFSFDGAGLGVMNQGITLEHREQGDIIGAFVGASAIGYQGPFLQAAKAQHIGAGFYSTKHFRSLRVSTVDVIDGGQHTAVLGLGDEWKGLRVSGAGGLMQNHSYYVGQASYQWKHANLQGSHQDFYQPFRATSNNVGGYAGVPLFSVWGNLLKSDTFQTVPQQTTGMNAGVSSQVGILRFSGNWFESNTVGALHYRNTFTMESITATLHHRYMLSLIVSQNDGHNTFNGGIGYTASRWSASINQNVVWTVQKGFVQSENVQVTFRFHSVLYNLGMQTSEFNKPLYQAYADDYLSKAHSASTKDANGDYVIAGECRMANGMPVEGCAVKIGEGKKVELVFSDAKGRFELRRKKAGRMKLAVSEENFMTAGTYHTVSADEEAATDRPFIVVVKR